jgi:hypothetical protein
MTFTEAKEIVAFAKANGIKKFKLGDLEFELEPSKVVGESIIPDGIGQEYKPTEDEMLLYSTPFYDELVEQRKNP